MKRPIFFTLISLALLLSAGAYMGRVIVLLTSGQLELRSALADPWWIALIGAVAAGISLWRMRSWGFYVYAACWVISAAIDLLADLSLASLDWRGFVVPAILATIYFQYRDRLDAPSKIQPARTTTRR